MKHIFKFFVAIFIFASCSKEEIEIYDMKANIDEITKIELRADHSTLLRNGVAKMNFRTIAYGEKELLQYGKVDGVFKTDTVKIEYIIPNDLLPENAIKIVDNNGKEVGKEGFSTTSLPAGATVEFSAKVGNLESNHLTITIREIPDESYDEIIVPVIFHMIVPPASAGPQYDITSEHLQTVIDRVNDVYNRKITSDPNGGNVKVIFKLALYDKSGIRLTEPGKNVRTLTTANIQEINNQMGTTNMAIAYDRFFVKNKSNYIWDPNKYLNIWVTKFTANTADASYSYKYLAPAFLHSSYPVDAIGGLTMKSKDSFELSDITYDAAVPANSVSCLQVGIIVNYSALLNPQAQGGNEFRMGTVLGYYYGLLDTKTAKNTYPSIDPDYCADTKIYYNSSSVNISMYKDNSSYTVRPEDVPLEYFTSFNVMDIYTRGNSVSVDQATRIRSVVEKCPTRWAYKSNFAFTGK